MNKNAPIILGVIAALFGAFMIVGNMPITVEDFEGNLTVDGNLNVTGTGEFGGDVDMNHNYILESDLSHWFQFSFSKGVTDETINIVGAGILIQDRHFHRMTLTVNIAPGGAQEVNVTLSNGVETMFVELTGNETAGWTQTTEFDWDVSAQALTLTYSQSAGGASTMGFITIKYHYMETT